MTTGELHHTRVGTGRTVVLLHTLRTQLEYFGPLIELLDHGRVEAVAVDLPGHGRSPAPRADYTAGYFADAVEHFLEHARIDDAIVVGDSIGATIGLTLAARGYERVDHVVAVNPYDYGRRGGVRRGSIVANIVFSTMLWPAIGPVVAGSKSRWVLRKVMEGGLVDRSALPPQLIDDMRSCGALPGHARAFRSLNQQWRSWIAARAHYPAIRLPVTLVYGSNDWSYPSEREAAASLIPEVRVISLDGCGHFASLERPAAIADLIQELA